MANKLGPRRKDKNIRQRRAAPGKNRYNELSPKMGEKKNTHRSRTCTRVLEEVCPEPAWSHPHGTTLSIIQMYTQKKKGITIILAWRNFRHRGRCACLYRGVHYIVRSFWISGYLLTTPAAPSTIPKSANVLLTRSPAKAQPLINNKNSCLCRR